MGSAVSSVTYGRGFPKPAPLEVDGTALAVIDRTTGELIPPSEDPLVIRQWIEQVAQRLLDAPEKMKDDVRHTILGDVYMRELFIPKGFLLVGKLHKRACMNVVSKGDISVLTETGSARVQAGYSVISPAGIQKLGFAHEDTVFVNVFSLAGIATRDIAQIEKLLFCDSHAALAQEEAQMMIEGTP